MRIQLRQNARLRIDGLVWAVERRVSTGVQLVGVGDGALRVIRDDELLQKFREGAFEQLSPAIDPNSTRSLIPHNTDFLCIPEDKRADAIRRAKYLDALFGEAGPPPYSNSRLVEIIPLLHERIKDEEPQPSLRTLRRWLQKQNLLGFDGPADVLIQIPDPQRRQGNRAERIKKAVEDIMQEVLDNYVMCLAPAPINEIYATLIQRIKDENLVHPNDPIPFPSLKTFYRRADKLDDEERIKRQRGRKAARDAYGSPQVAPREHIPLAVVEIDHNYIDCEVVDDDGIVLGRPILTAAIDRATGMCVGYVLTWEPPSSTCGMLVLRHMILDKSYVKSAFGDKIRHDWPCFGVPTAIVIDNGADFHSKHFQQACAGLGRIQIIYAEPGHPQIRGKIERFFRTLNSGLIHLLPGTTLSRVDRGSDYDPSRAAIVPLRKLNELLHKFIIDIYHRRPLRRGNKDSRVDLWNKGVEKYPPRLPSSLRQLKILSCAFDTRRLRKTGIEIFSTYYRSPEFAAVRIKAKSDVKGNIKVVVYYDPTDLGCIWVKVPGEERLIEAVSIAPKYFNGRTIWQHKKVLEHLGDKARDATEADLLQAVAELRDMIDEVSGRKSKRYKTKRAAARFTERPVTPSELAGGEGQLPNYESMDEAFAPEVDDTIDIDAAVENDDGASTETTPAPAQTAPQEQNSPKRRSRNKPQPTQAANQASNDTDELAAFIHASGMNARRRR